MRFVAQSRPGSWTRLNKTERSLHNWLQLPPGFNPRALALARQWRQQLGDDPNVLAAHVLRWIREEPFHYTLSPPKLGKDSIDEFLFQSRAGFCEHYSSAFVFMMRAMGVPARVVTGYQGAEHHAQDDYWIVRQAKYRYRLDHILYKFDNIYRLLDNLTVSSGSPRLQTFIDFYIFPT